MKRRTLLATGAAAASAACAGPARPRADAAQGRLRLCRPDRRRRLDLPARPGPLAVEAHFGDKVETIYQENVPEGADAERVLTQMALSGAATDLHHLLRLHGRDGERRRQVPDVKFEHATGYKRAANVATYDARFYEGRAVIGHIAGKMTKTNKIGYIASFPIPEVIQGINSYFLHAKKVNPTSSSS
jgi:basic membrane protein A and related proteins